MEEKESLKEWRSSSIDVKQEPFLPLSFRRSTLVCTAVTTLLFLGITGFLHFLDARDGAVLVGREDNGLSIGQVFLIRYLPIILTVLYGSWITTLDLDVKRLEPWLQLSLRSPSPSASSLLCRYDTEFILSVLAKSFLARYCISWGVVLEKSHANYDRHWIVFASTWLAILATIVLPAVQNSMFSIQTQASNRPLFTSQPEALADLNAQKTLMSNNFLLSGYSTTWLGQNSPAFSTKEYALAPFQVNSLDMAGHGGDNGVVTAPTTRYWAELGCWSPNSITINTTGHLVSFNDAQSCNAANFLSYDATTIATYDQSAQYEAYLFSSSSLGGNPFLPYLKTTCPDDPHLLLATWRKAGAAIPDFAEGGNATSMFCQAEYYSEPVNATLKISDFSVVSYVATGSRSQLPDTVFNRTHFEYIATSGAPPPEDTLNNLTFIVDIADAAYVAQKTRIQNMSVVAPDQQSNDVLIGFALGLTQLPAKDYLDFETLSSAYNSAMQLLFVHAIRYTFNGSVDQGSNLNAFAAQSATQHNLATWTLQEEVVRIVPGFAIATEVLLAAMCIICIFLLVSMPKRSLRLLQNPDTLAEVMLLSRSTDLQDFFSHCNASSERSLQHLLEDELFKLEDDEQGPLLRRMEAEDATQVQRLQAIHSLAETHEKPARSPETSWIASGFVTLALSGGTCLLIVLTVLTERKNGLEMLPSSSFVQQMLLNFLPTAAATLLALYLTLVCRLNSFLKPMYDLACGDADAHSTLLVRYTSLPPQLLLFRAFCARHYLLGTMSMATLLSSVLTVTAASMFVLQQADVSLPLQFIALYQPNIIENTSQVDLNLGVLPGSSAVDGKYATLANMSDFTPLPTWTTDSYGFLPINLPKSFQGRSASSYQLQSLGYGAELQCFDLQKPSGDLAGNIVFHNNSTTFQVWANFTSETTGTTECIFDSGLYNNAARLNLTNLPTTTAALEISNVMGRWNGSTSLIDEFCGTRIVKGWIRASASPDTTGSNEFAMDYNATIILCQAQMTTRQFSLETTSDGDILSATPVGDINYDLPPSVNFSASLNTVLVNTRDIYSIPQWHNDTIARDWSNYMYHVEMGNRDFLNVSLPPPTVETASKVVSNMFSRLFAVQLSLDRDKLQPTSSDNSTTTLQARDTNPSNTTNTTQASAKAIIPTQKVFMSKINTAISLAILTFDLVVLIIFRLTLPKPFLPRMPFTIASQIAFFSGSHVIDDVVKAGGDLKKLDELGYRYAYGKYIGKDGWLHTGIERAQFVTKL